MKGMDSLASTQTRPVEIISLLDPPTPCFVPIRYRPGNLGTWSGHLAFANDLIADIRPSLLVELGTHWGESYFTFCQSVYQNGVDCVCYAVDHWLGEPHAGHYGEEVFADVQQFNETHYRGFSYLLRTGFDEAREQFSDESVDLLHIDGLHTYEAVSHDFQTWLRKVKPGGIILMHDIAVRHADFGVWRFWDELKIEFPQHFEFHHWWGLGVLRKPGGDRGPSAFQDLLFNSSPVMAERIRRHYLMQTAFLENTRPAEPKSPAASVASPALQTGADAGVDCSSIQIYPFGHSGYSESSSMSQPLQCGSWKDLAFAIPEGTGKGPIRIDPADCASVIEIQSIVLRDEATGAALFSALGSEDFRNLYFTESTLPFQGNSACCILSLSSDPYFFLPAEWKSDAPVRLEISLQVRTTKSDLLEGFQQWRHSNSIEMKAKQEHAVDAALAGSAEEASRWGLALTAAEKESSEARARAERLEEQLAATKVSMRYEMQREVRILQELLDNAEERLRETEHKLEGSAALEQELQSTKVLLENERALLVNERVLRATMLHSKSWALTRPLRNFRGMFKSGD